MIIYNKPSEKDTIYTNKPSYYTSFTDYINKNPLSNEFICCITSPERCGETIEIHNNYFGGVSHSICNYYGCVYNYYNQNYNILAAQICENDSVCARHYQTNCFCAFNQLKFNANSNFCIRYCLCGWQYGSHRFVLSGNCGCAFSRCSSTPDFKTYIDIVKSGGSYHICSSSTLVATDKILYLSKVDGCGSIFPFCIKVLSGNVKYIGRTDQIC